MPQGSEAIRAGILELGREYGTIKSRQDIEDEMAVKRMQGIDEQIKAGKIRLLSEEEALGKYRRAKK